MNLLLLLRVIHLLRDVEQKYRSLENVTCRNSTFPSKDQKNALTYLKYVRILMKTYATKISSQAHWNSHDYVSCLNWPVNTLLHELRHSIEQLALDVDKILSVRQKALIRRKTASIMLKGILAEPNHTSDIKAIALYRPKLEAMESYILELELAFACFMLRKDVFVLNSLYLGRKEVTVSSLNLPPLTGKRKRQLPGECSEQDEFPMTRKRKRQEEPEGKSSSLIKLSHVR